MSNRTYIQVTNILSCLKLHSSQKKKVYSGVAERVMGKLVFVFKKTDYH